MAPEVHRTDNSPMRSPQAHLSILYKRGRILPEEEVGFGCNIKDCPDLRRPGGPFVSCPHCFSQNQTYKEY
jgi:hypothetical protein